MASFSASAAPLLRHTRDRLFADKLSFCMKGSSLKITNLTTDNSDGASKKMLKLDSKVFQDKAIDGLNPLSKQIPEVKTLAASAISTPTTQVETSPLEKIKTGFLRFKEYFKQEQALFKQLAESQHPMFMIIACADSRVDPCTILGLGLGEAFVIRNVANLVPPYSAKSCSSTASAIEYAVLHLKVEHLMVIGHSRCGGVKALMGMKEDDSNRFSEFIEDWVMVAKGASRKVKGSLRNTSFEDQCTFCEKEVVNHSLWNCLSFPFVRDKVAAGELSLHGGYYDFVNGSFERWSVDFSNMTGFEKLE